MEGGRERPTDDIEVLILKEDFLSHGQRSSEKQNEIKRTVQ